MQLSALDSVLNSTKDAGIVANGGISILNAGEFASRHLDRLVFDSVFHHDAEMRTASRWVIHQAALELGAFPYSIQDLYTARGRGEVGGFTVPAINIRGFAYEFARAVFRAALKNRCAAMIFELSRGEMEYTEMRPAEYSTCVLGAAIREGFKGPIFVQGDHYQVHPRRYAANPQREVDAVKSLCREAIAARYFNVDIDTSTLVDLSKPTVREQQRLNFERGAEINATIRDLEPPGITISVGGEIGEVGGHNSTAEELRAYMDGYLETLGSLRREAIGVSKVSINTGTTHGGIPLSDGTVAPVKLDFECLRTLSRVARDEYRLSGAVQHGASTLPAVAFDNFPKVETAELHLATEFQNIYFEIFPEELRREIFAYCAKEFVDERKPEDTDEQFFYRTRKKATGAYKRAMWTLPSAIRDRIGEELESKVDFLMKKLNVTNTAEMVDDKIKINRDAVAGMPLDLSGRLPITGLRSQDRSASAD